jgi:hypothetical protein
MSIEEFHSMTNWLIFGLIINNMSKMKKKECFVITAILFLIVASSGSCDRNTGENGKEQPGNQADVYPVAASGWDIYQGGTYRYGPSVIINDDGSADAWFAASGGYFGDFLKAYDSSGASEAVSLGASNVAAQYFSISAPFYSVDVRCPSWSGNPASLTLSLYRWDTDYDTTLKSLPVRQRRFVNYADNAWLSLDRTTKDDESAGDGYFPAGDYLWVLDGGATIYSGVWKNAGDAEDLDAVSFYNGGKISGNYQARIAKEYSSGDVYWDQVSYRHSDDGGKTWTPEVMVLKPTEGSRDRLSICDPGVAKWGGYYYIGYTSTEHEGGIDNHVYVCRGKSPAGPWEKWNGAGWGGNPQPVITYTGNHAKWGAGEPSLVVLNDTVFFYYSWNDEGTATRLSTASASDPEWPAHLTHQGTVIDKSSISAADHCDVKYCPALKKFYAIHTAERITPGSYIMLWESSDGIKFNKVGRLKGIFQPYLHNCGLSGDEYGHMDINSPQYISYAYGENWGQWKTRWSPLTFK